MIWGGSKLLPEKWLDALRFSVKIETVFFCPNWGVLQKKKGLPWNLNGFSVQMKVFSKKKKKKKKKRSSPKLRQYFGNGVPKYPDYLPKLIDHLPEFLTIFDVLYQMGGRPPPLPPRLLRLCLPPKNFRSGYVPALRVDFFHPRKILPT